MNTGRTSESIRSTGLALGLISFALFSSLMATGCGHKAEAAAGEPQTQVVKISTINPLRKDLTREVDQPGYLKPYEQTPIYTKIAGFAKEPRFDIGDRVKKGQLLVDLFVPEVVQDLRVKAARVDQAKADLKQAKEAANAAKAAREAARADVDAKMASIHSAEAQVMRWKAEDVRSHKLMEKGIYDQQTADEVINQRQASEALRDEAKAKWISSQATLEQASAHYNKTLADIDVAAASVAVAEATHDQWRDWLAYAQITAPYDGVITLRNVHDGHFLQPSNSGSTSKAAEPLFVMMRTDIMRCTVEVPELDAVLVKEHDKAIVRFQAMPGIEFLGEVTRFSYSLDDRSRTLRVEIHLKNPDGALRPGMYGNVTILAKLKNAWTLPASAIMSDILADGDRDYCFMVEGGKARKTFLKTGTKGDEGVQILSKQRGQGKKEDITGKELVVVTNPKALQDGQDVELEAPATPGQGTSSQNPK
jgi:RND family efflux transporter MFP subunit